MIKKSVFEHDLIVGMQQELRKQASAEQPNLVKAGECLHAALEILEEAGLQSKADQVLSILSKIANPMKAPSLQDLLEHGLTTKDLQDFGQGIKGAKIKMNSVLRNMGFDEHHIAQFIGKHNVVPEKEIKQYLHIMKMIQTPTVPLASAVPEEIGFKSIVPSETDSTLPQVTFKSIAGKPHKPRRPDTIHPGLPHNGHTKNLTPEKMIENLMQHGTVFNMASDGVFDIGNANFDPELAEVLGVNDADDLLADDVFDADIVDDTLEVSDQVPLEDFEDEVSNKVD